MILENINVYDLVPTQIEDMINRLKKALDVVKNRKQTISKTASYEKNESICPHCHSCNIVKNGLTKNKVQTYKCKDCSKRFNDLTSTVLEKSHLTYEQIEIFLQCFRDKVSLRKTAKRMDVDKNTVHLLRLKMMDSFKNTKQKIKLSGEVEADEIYRSINLKGTKPKNMPRFSKHRTSKGTSIRGISSHKVCIESAIDENDTAFFEIVGTGPITSDMVKESLAPKLGNVSKLITDCKTSYESLTTENDLNLKQIKSKYYTDDEGNNLANINSLHSGLTTFLSKFRGVSTKHLQGYLDWYTFDKYFNYFFEEEQQNNEILKVSFTNSTELNINNAYDNYSGIDFTSVYSDYEYHYIPSRTN